MIDFVGRRRWYFLLSLATIVPGVISLLIPPALRSGIEFTSGSTILLRFERPPVQELLRETYAALGHSDAIIQRTGQGEFLIRTRTLAPEQRDAAGALIQPSEQQRIEQEFRARFGDLTVLDFASVSPLVAVEIVRNAAIAVLAAAVGILLYITWAFRRMPYPFRYGTCAVIALVHDLLVVVGIFSILGKVAGTEINSMFITALLTVAGYSVHDTIVVFDRIRENRHRDTTMDFDTVVNRSLTETVGRSLTTSLTVVLTQVALLLFGGVTIRDFVLVLLIGTVSGTYSSIFTASQLLVSWEHGELRSLAQRATLPVVHLFRLLFRLPALILRRG